MRPPYKTDALLMAYVSFFNAKELVEKMLFARRIRTNTKGATIFEEIRGCFEENGIPMENIIACATDGAASMSVFTIHCAVHREHLVVNFIKSHTLQNRLFRQLCEENGEDFDTLLLHTEVRWLSKGNCLQRFVALWDSIVAFMSDKDFGEKLIDAKADIFDLTGIFQKLNLLNKALRGKDSDLISSKSAVVSFVKKLELYLHNLDRREFSQFPNLKTIAGILKDEDLLAYVFHLKQVTEDMKERFCDLLNLDIPSWILDPFGVPAVEVHPEVQEELIELQSDVIARHAFGQFCTGFWIKHDLPNKFPTLWRKVEQFPIAFPSTYLVECAFSKVVSLMKSRNRMDAAARGDLRLSLTRLEPEIMKLSKAHAERLH
uniref:HAT C-terminal dimerisation domain-containing protein n=1 Tax=Trichuris muris TaxID=70415 RepID=A0A5S6QB77_TRIMR